ncbi:hypothetical protein FGA82_30460 [Pseudomonas fluorescens]|uniref:hypothetical protein n=1 Tax=Pseudomonas fluorescens TaxID=294 RepID=UPI0011315309|nr:hypothetical protein [Pseudomonas fluorescens]TMU69387.1 hypothetical protein FGA82_30460 [Pseudomonas fluorescens]
MTEVVVKQLDESQAYLAKGLVPITPDFWVVYHDGIIVCVSSKRNAFALKAYIEEKALLCKFLNAIQLAYVASLKGKNLANCASEEYKKWLEDQWGTPPPPGDSSLHP